MTESRWRSPSRIPRPVDPATIEMPRDPLQRLLLGGAWRCRAFAHSLAHGLRRVPGGAAQGAVVTRLIAALRVAGAFGEIAARHGIADPERVVQARLALEPLPGAESWAEVAVADALFGAALDFALRSLAGSRDADLAAVARMGLGESFGGRVLSELAAEPANRACLQLLVDRWAGPALQVFGRPDSPAEQQLLDAGIKPESAAIALSRHLSDTEQRLRAWRLDLPSAQRLGLHLHSAGAPAERP